MTSEEFRTFKRVIALNAIKFEQGHVSAKDFCDALYVILGKETYEETNKLMTEREIVDN